MAYCVVPNIVLHLSSLAPSFVSFVSSLFRLSSLALCHGGILLASLPILGKKNSDTSVFPLPIILKSDAPGDQPKRQPTFSIRLIDESCQHNAKP